jgi:hypothetical protein
MSSTREREEPPAASQQELARFALGWRAIQVNLPDGSTSFEQAPLTLEDVMHPEFGDHPAVSYAHYLDVSYLRSVLSDRLAGDPGIAVLSELIVYWDKPEWKHHRPDIAVVPGVSHRQNGLFFQVAHEGTRPSLILEVVSPNTRVNDVEAKVEQYARVGVPRYVIADVCESGGRRCLSLIDYRLSADGHYERQALDARRRVGLKEAGGLWLGTFFDHEYECDRLALVDPVNRVRIRDYAQVTDASLSWGHISAPRELPAELLAEYAALREAVSDLRRWSNEGSAT